MKITCNSIKRTAALFFLLSMYLLSAHAEAPQRIEGNVDLDGAKLNVEANLFSPDVTKAPILLCKPTDWEGVDVVKVFFADRSYTAKDQQGDKGAVFPIYTSYDNEKLSLFPGIVYYETEEGTTLARAINTYDANRFMNGVGEPEGELPSFPAKEALQLVIPYIENLGLTPTANMAEAIPYAAKDLVDTEPELDVVDSYVVRMPIAYQGVPLITHPFLLQSIDYNGGCGYVEAVVSQDGLQYFEIRGSVFDVVKMVEEAAPIITAQSALDRLVEELSMMILEEDIHIVQIELSYVPMPMPNEATQVLFTPAWILYWDQGSGSIDHYYINAITGDYIF